MRSYSVQAGQYVIYRCGCQDRAVRSRVRHASGTVSGRQGWRIIQGREVLPRLLHQFRVDIVDARDVGIAEAVTQHRGVVAGTGSEFPRCADRP